MTVDLWNEVDRLLGDALELPESQRRAFVQSACAGRPEVAAQISSLLAEAGRQGPLDALMPGGEGDEEPAASLVGRRLGPYQLVREIGRGGMGSVWLAERHDRQFEKRVAIKVLAAGLPVSEALRRFRDERQILASLEHPHIARLLDAGRSDEGLHYIVMEFVEGVPITDHCRAHALDMAARVALLRTIASAVHFAHQRLVVHRDLKPANILVAPDGEPRLLDFGVAKMLDRGAESDTVPLLHLATPAYASPEQLRGLPATTTSDIYSLGILCCELLAGERPDRSGAEPERPSAVAARLAATPADGRARAAALTGDLDAIVMKATRTAPQERYASAEELAADLGRYLAGLPVLARSATFRYRARKFVARHRAGVAAAVVAALIAIAGVTTILWQTSVARRERRAADARFNDVRQLAGTMIFDLYDRIAELPGSTTAREVLVTKALQYFDGLSREAAGDRALSLELASAYLRVADVQFNTSYANLGDTRGALASLASARRILDEQLARDPANVPAQRLLARQHLAAGAVHLYLQHAAEARASVDLGLALREQLAAAGDDTDRRELAGAYHRLADVMSLQDHEASLTPRRRALQMFEALLAAHPEDEETRRSLALAAKTLGSSLNDLHRYTEAETHYARALAIDEQRVKANPNSALARLDLSFDLSLLATLRMNHDDNRGALVYWERTIAVRKSLVDADPRDARAKGRLAFAYLRASASHFQLADFAAGVDAGEKALALTDSLLAVNPDDAISRSYATQAWRQIGVNERELAKRADRDERPLRQSRACSAFGRALEGYQTTIAAGRADANDRINAEEMQKAAAGCPALVAAKRERAHQ